MTDEANEVRDRAERGPGSTVSLDECVEFVEQLLSPQGNFEWTAKSYAHLDAILSHLRTRSAAIPSGDEALRAGPAEPVPEAAPREKCVCGMGDASAGFHTPACPMSIKVGIAPDCASDKGESGEYRYKPKMAPGTDDAKGEKP